MAQSFEIVREIEALELEFRQPVGQGQARAQWLANWTNDLASYDIEDIRKGCRHWRRVGQRFPKLGDLEGAIRTVTKLKAGERVPEWEPISEDEYQRLDLPGKIRHHQIMAHRARCRAGPMFRNVAGSSMFKIQGRHLTREEMPQEWHDLQARVDGHEKEVKRLRDLLRGGGKVIREEPEAPRLPYAPETNPFDVEVIL